MASVYRCDICGHEATDRSELMPVFLSIGLLSRETQDNFERIDLCTDCWPQSRKTWRDSFIKSLAARDEKGATTP